MSSRAGVVRCPCGEDRSVRAPARRRRHFCRPPPRRQCRRPRCQSPLPESAVGFHSYTRTCARIATCAVVVKFAPTAKLFPSELSATEMPLRSPAASPSASCSMVPRPATTTGRRARECAFCPPARMFPSARPHSPAVAYHLPPRRQCPHRPAPPRACTAACRQTESGTACTRARSLASPPSVQSSTGSETRP